MITAVRPSAASVPSPAPPTRRRLGPAWPLVALLGLYPIWWALGLGVLIFPIMAAPMAALLYRAHARGGRIVLPPGFVWWLVFAAVLVFGLLTLGEEPTGTVAGGFADRITGVGYRLIQYSALTVLLVYAGNLPVRLLSQRRLVQLLGLMFAITVLGGLLGTFAGGFEFTSPVELLLPSHVREKGFVRSLVHPYAAQIMDLVGDPQPRPAAPWGYTNTWGNNFCLLIVWFAVAVFGARTRPLVKTGAVVLLAASVIPVVHSLNRGLWIGLGVTAGYVAVRQALLGRLKALVALGVLTAALLAAVVVTPLGDVISARLDNGKSNGVRMFLTERALAGFAESPVLGFGSTRTTIGGRQSITVGESASCERCGNFTIGGNGQLWQLLFAHGLVGTIGYFGFFGYGLWRFRRDRSAIGIAGSAAIITSFVSSLWYNSLVTPLAFAFLGYVLLWRNSQFISTASIPHRSPPVAVEPHVTRTPSTGGTT